VQEFLLRVELPGGGSISQEVRPEDKMATNSQNGDIITLSMYIQLHSSFLFVVFQLQRYI
jgi:hypothetical protein